MAIKRVMRYLVGTRDLAICYDKQKADLSRSSSLLLIGYTNADHRQRCDD